ncbi:MAG: NAD-dependent epimerase/dehydratase family protein [Candidatus Helarchaeota archaeon]|nr:NAD-dependent epimerase/dehydratase family protein [Candidatus Helarchaeota archaeon]
MDNPLEADLNDILDHTRDLWEELRGERIFITGGTGFFGCWLLESLTWVNDRLGLRTSAVVLTRNPEAFRFKAPHLSCHPALQFIKGDVRTFDFPTGSFSHLIHAAADASAKLNVEKPLEMFDTIVSGTRRTLDFALQSGVRKFLFVSSGAVYGKQPPELTHIPEDYTGAPDPTDPLSTYGEGKRAAELLCTLYTKQSGLEVKIARCFAFVGPYLPLDAHFAIGNFIRDGLKGGPIRVNGDGTPLRSYLYAADLMVWLWTILMKGQSCRPYNVGSEDKITIANLAHVVARFFNPRLDVIISKVPLSYLNPEAYIPDTSRARSELDLITDVNLSTAIEKTIAFYQRI